MEQGLGAANPLLGGAFGGGESFGSESQLDDYLSERGVTSYTPFVDWRNVPYGAAPYDKQHHKNTAQCAVSFARFLGLNEFEIAEVFLAAMLHDIGQDRVWDNSHYQTSTSMAEKILNADSNFWEKDNRISLDKICRLIKNHNNIVEWHADKQWQCLYDADKYDAFRHSPNTEYGIKKVREAFRNPPIIPQARDHRLVQLYAKKTYNWDQRILDVLFPLK